VASVQILEDVLVVKRMMVNVAVMVAAKLVSTTQKSASSALLVLKVCKKYIFHLNHSLSFDILYFSLVISILPTARRDSPPPQPVHAM
jgi:hypothetical protein